MSVVFACGGVPGETDTASNTVDATSAPTSNGPETGNSGGTAAEPSGDPTGAGQVCEAEVRSGEATYYGADGSGNCSFDPSPEPMVAAMNFTDYAASAACGACVEIDGPDGQITVHIVDSCPECPQGDIDLGEAAFPMIAAKELGRVPITWRYVSCATTGPIVYHFKEGSNEWWTAVQIRGHKNPIAGLSFMDEMGQWQAVARVDYNYFVAEGGMGPGPYAFRVTDTQGNVLEDSNVPFVEAGDVAGAGQFPACE